MMWEQESQSKARLMAILSFLAAAIFSIFGPIIHKKNGLFEFFRVSGDSVFNGISIDDCRFEPCGMAGKIWH